MKLLFVVTLALLGALVASPALAGGYNLAKPGASTTPPPANSSIATWLSFRYDTCKEAEVSLPGHKDYQKWLVGGRCRWIQGLNVAAGYEVWTPNLDTSKEIRTTRGGICFQHNNKAAELSLERSSFTDPTKEPAYGAVAAFSMQF
ncbi:MAG: hypothetical protein V2A77_11845 [Pseudomonadota bacterium]